GESLAGIATHVLVGHAEMREYSDNQDKVEAKYKRASEYLLSPVLCIRKSDEMISGAKIVAYEPIYAIGTGVVASADEIRSMKDEIKNISDCIFLYGGSVAKENIHSLLTSNVCDGFLIGGASLDPVGFAELVNISA
ncbi:MAG: triose-phosphate isomerase, partial [Patescibacteria group bacterium]